MGFWDEVSDKQYSDAYGVSLEKAAQERQHRELMRSLNKLQENSRVDSSFLLTDEQRRDIIERNLALKEAQVNYRPTTGGRIIKVIGAMLVLPLGSLTAQALDVQAGAQSF